MLKALVTSLALLVSAAALTAPSIAASGGSNTSTLSRSEVRLEAKMRSGVVEAKVAWREEVRGTTVSRKLQAEVSRGKPNATYTVTHNGKQIATFKTNSLGNGYIELERNVVAMKAGDAVAVGTLKGALARR